MNLRSSLICILLAAGTYNTAAQEVLRYSILITEIFPDPAPSKGLPAAEFIELYNAGMIPVDLAGWKISDENGMALIRNSFLFMPGTYLILCANSSLAEFSAFGQAIGISGFPSLDNNSEILFVSDPSNRIIHSIHYNKNWYRSLLKEEGGFSLEMIDPENLCGGRSNWNGSSNSKGGTPGALNSVYAQNPDQLSPGLLRTWVIDSLTIVAVFDEPINPETAGDPDLFTLTQSVRVEKAVPIEPLFNEIRLQLEKPISIEMSQLQVKDVCDCVGNKIQAMNSTKLSLPRPPEKNALVLNELLFNPKPETADYIEIYNRSNKAVDLQHLYLASRSGNSINNIRSLSAIPYLLFPGEYLAFTSDSQAICKAYLPPNPSRVRQLPSLPAMPDKSGTVILIDQNEMILDEVSYSEDWQFPLINNPDGVALERINPDLESNARHNWTSAAHIVQYGTPGYQNSQYRADLGIKGRIGFTEKMFSPDNDGDKDLAEIVYQLDEPGYMLTVLVCDRNGKIVKSVAKNLVAGISGRFYWDGTDDNRRSLNPGIYIMVASIFSLDRKSKNFRELITLAKRF